MYDANAVNKRRATSPPDYFTDDVNPYGYDYNPDDILRQERQGGQRAAIAAGIGAAGSLAQLGLTAIDTAQDRENDRRLAELKKDKGLSAAERADIDEQAMRGVRALASEAQTRNDDALAASGRHSAADLQRARRSNTDAVNRAAISAADIGIRQDREQVRRDTQEEQERISYKSDRSRQRIEMLGQTLAGVMQASAAPIAAGVVVEEPSMGLLVSMRGAVGPDGKPAYPSLQGKSGGELRRAWRDSYSAP